MNNKKYNVGWCFLFFIVTLFSSCQKTEFMPEPEGNQVPYQPEATQTVEQILASSPAKIFYEAWQKSTMKSRLEAKGHNVQFTLFVPSDDAFRADGITSAQIAQMDVKDVDSLMMFYTSDKVIVKEQLGSTSTPVKTLLEQKNLYVEFYESDLGNQQTYDLYHHKFYLAVRGDELLIYGKSTGKLNYQPATNGGIYFLEKTVQKATKTTDQVIRSDDRFSMFLEVMQLADEAYFEKIATDMEMYFGYPPSAEEIKAMYSYTIPRKYLGENWGAITPPIYPGYIGANMVMNTVFIPTNEAFKNAGFQTAADIMRFNENNNVRFDDMTFEPAGGMPIDTILSYHYDWGRLLATKDPSYGLAANNRTVFYSNDLRPELLNEYYVNIGGNAAIQYAYKSPLNFTAHGDKRQLNVKESSFPAAVVVEADINTLNGPIHVVDHLLLPKGFKLN